MQRSWVPFLSRCFDASFVFVVALHRAWIHQLFHHSEREWDPFSLRRSFCSMNQQILPTRCHNQTFQFNFWTYFYMFIIKSFGYGIFCTAHGNEFTCSLCVCFLCFYLGSFITILHYCDVFLFSPPCFSQTQHRGHWSIINLTQSMFPPSTRQNVDLWRCRLLLSLQG